jgi:hypothetical protein
LITVQALFRLVQAKKLRLAQLKHSNIKGSRVIVQAVQARYNFFNKK